MKTKEDNVPKVYNKHIDRNVKTNRQLIPRHYLRFLPVILGSQDKWDLVFEKVIAKLDELDTTNQPVSVKVKESSK